MIFQFVKSCIKPLLSHLECCGTISHFRAEGAPLNSSIFSTSHLEVIFKSPGSHQVIFTFTWPRHRPCHSPCLSCQSVPGSSTSPGVPSPSVPETTVSLASSTLCGTSPCPGQTQGTADCFSTSQGCWGKAKKSESRKRGYYEATFLFQAIFCTGWGPDSSSGKQRKTVSPPPTLLGPFSGLDVKAEHLYRNPQ